MSTTSHDDARRYVTLARSGWTDPDVEPLALIETLCGEYDTDVEAAIAERSEEFETQADEHAAQEKAWREERDELQRNLDAARAEIARLSVPGRWTLAEILDALPLAVERERERCLAEARAACDREHVEPKPRRRKRAA